jgi:HEAT repeat protein
MLRQQAAYALMEQDAERALLILIENYRADDDEGMGRQALIERLGRFGTAVDLPLLRWIQHHDHTPSENAGWPLSAVATRAIARIEARQQHATHPTEP